MTKHSCNKEKELAEMGTNQKWIMEQMKDIVPKINNMHDVFTSGEGKIKVLNKTIFGNGKKGLLERVENIETLINKAEGGKIVVQGIGSFTKWLIGLLATGNVLSLGYIFVTKFILG